MNSTADLIADLLYDWDVEAGSLGVVGILYPSRSSAPEELRQHYKLKGDRLCEIARRGWSPVKLNVLTSAETSEGD